jgi:lipid-A-disaccharide synthase
MSLEIMAISDAAIVASGTATLECGLLGTPMVVVYVLDRSTYEIAREKVKIPYVSLVNLIAGRAVLTEYIQDFDDAVVAKEVSELIHPGARRDSALSELANLRNNLEGGAAKRAAQIIVADLDHKGSRGA